LLTGDLAAHNACKDEILGGLGSLEDVTEVFKTPILIVGKLEVPSVIREPPGPIRDHPDWKNAPIGL
jgi:hypothetical protein